MSIEDDVALLERVPTLRLLGDTALRMLAIGSEQRDFERGETLFNAGDETINLPAQSKICQLIFEKIITPTAVWADEISETQRGRGGFGSTG